MHNIVDPIVEKLLDLGEGAYYCFIDTEEYIDELLKVDLKSPLLWYTVAERKKFELRSKYLSDKDNGKYCCFIVNPNGEFHFEK